MKKFLCGIAIILSLSACSSSGVGRAISAATSSSSSSSSSRQASSKMTLENTVSFSGVTKVGDTLYAVAGSTIGLNPVTVKSVSGENARFKNVMYFVDSNMVGERKASSSPTFSTSNLAPGKHILSAAVTVEKPDGTVAGVPVNIPLIIVPDAASLPQNAPAIGTYSHTVRVSK